MFMQSRTDPSKEGICLSLEQLASWTAAQSHNHTGTRSSKGGEAGWQQTLKLAPLETLGPISTTKSRLSVLSGPSAPHGNSTACPTAHLPARLASGACCLLALVRKCLMGSILRSIPAVAHPSCSTTAAPWCPSSIHLSCGNGITISLCTQFQSHLIRSEVTASLTSSVPTQHPARIPEAPADVFAAVLPTAVSHGAALGQLPQRW